MGISKLFFSFSIISDSFKPIFSCDFWINKFWLIYGPILVDLWSIFSWFIWRLKLNYDLFLDEFSLSFKVIALNVWGMFIIGLNMNSDLEVGVPRKFHFQISPPSPVIEWNYWTHITQYHGNVQQNFKESPTESPKKMMDVELQYLLWH